MAQIDGALNARIINNMNEQVAVIGCGRVGLPLVSYLVSKNIQAIGIDIVPPKNNQWGVIRNSPFKEEGLQELLDKHLVEVYNYEQLAANHFEPFDIIIITVGTPIDKNHNPDMSQLKSCLNSLLEHRLINKDTLVILRSTVFPGCTEWVADYLATHDIECDIAFAPERIAEGVSLKEIYSLPQPIGGISKKARDRAIDFFAPLIKEVVPMSSTKAAEMVKLCSNNYRYVNFALANELAIRCDELGIDYNEVREAVNHNYPRGGIAKASLNLGGPCLNKDWAILDYTSFVPSVVKKAYEVAEKTPTYFLNKYKNQIKYSNVGILGLAFKPESDNKTDSLSYKMIHMCESLNAKVMIHDPYIQHTYSKSIDDILKFCKIIFVMTNHSVYKDLQPLYEWQKIVRL